ncbi:uncharacterized protein LOC117303082 [Asterias rubens]|uniref:uncharacterized protein LOC117303082 n=1 Tax=Asterias rubens TaxID=7604 RepID=UPI001455401A|nr:uncharacterized protein LOC117303082 [Asterias rubens]
MPNRSKSSMLKRTRSQDSLRGVSDHTKSCMCRTVLPKDTKTKSHCGWYDFVDYDPCIDSDSLLNEKPLANWTQVAYGEATQGKVLLSEYRAYVSDETLKGFWTGLIIWQRDQNGFVHCPFPGCCVSLTGTSAVHTLMNRHWKHQHARPYLCNVCGSSYATDGALKVHFFRTRHNVNGRGRSAIRANTFKGPTLQSFSVHRREAITRYIHKVEKLMDDTQNYQQEIGP